MPRPPFAAALLASTLPLLALAAPAGAPQAAPDPKLLERARSILQRTPLIDTHNDIPYALFLKNAGDLTKVDLTKPQPELPADLPRLRAGRVGAQYWSVYVDSDTQLTRTSLHEALKIFDLSLRMIESRPELELARTADDIERITRAGKIASLLGVEGGHMIETSPAVVRIFHRLGARYLTLTHWKNVEWADAATDTPVHHGLTKHGELLVRELNRTGIFVDIDTKARPVKAVDVAPGGRDRLGHDVLGDPRMGERQSPGDVGNERNNVQRGRAGDARLPGLA